MPAAGTTSMVHDTRPATTVARKPPSPASDSPARPAARQAAELPALIQPITPRRVHLSGAGAGGRRYADAHHVYARSTVGPSRTPAAISAAPYGSRTMPVPM